MRILHNWKQSLSLITYNSDLLYRRAEWREAVDKCNKAALEPTTLQKYKEELERAQRRVEAITEVNRAHIKHSLTFLTLPQVWEITGEMEGYI